MAENLKISPSSRLETATVLTENNGVPGSKFEHSPDS